VPRVVVACDKFKGSLTAHAACAAVADGIASVHREVDVVELPVADGGEGTVAAALHAGFTPVEVNASGPTGDPVIARYARRGDLAVVELAEVCGFAHLPGGRPAPMTASSRGAGEVIGAAVDAGCRRVVLAVGGSTSTDGGAGLVQALGARVLDARGRDVLPGGAALAGVASVDVGPLSERLAGVAVSLACDVDNPLVGEMGAARVYAPQKGAAAPQVTELDAALSTWADVVATATGVDHRYTAGSGAAGGVGFAAVALLGAEARPGIELLLDLLDFDSYVRSADLVVTGEGSLDDQTLRGKAPAGVALVAVAAGVPVVAACGRNRLSMEGLRAAGITACFSCEDLEPDEELCMANAASLLRQIGQRIGCEHIWSPDD
jgi:glycerate 2-kinase